MKYSEDFEKWFKAYFKIHAISDEEKKNLYDAWQAAEILRDVCWREHIQTRIINLIGEPDYRKRVRKKK